MTILHERPTYVPRLHRRHEIVTTGGLAGIMRVSAILADHPVRDFIADIREGVGYGTVTCTVSLTDEECCGLVDRLRADPWVTSVSPC